MLDGDACKPGDGVVKAGKMVEAEIISNGAHLYNKPEVGVDISEDEVMAEINGTDSTKAARFASLMRWRGSTFLRAVDDPLKDVCPELNDIAKDSVSRSEYYQDLITLGRYMFEAQDIDQDKNGRVNFKVKYNVFSKLDYGQLYSAASVSFINSIQIRTWDSISRIGKRESIIWKYDPVPRAIMKSDFDAYRQSRLYHGDDDDCCDGEYRNCLLARALNMDLTILNEFLTTTEDVMNFEAVIFQHMEWAVGASRLTRYVKLWGTYLAMLQLLDKKLDVSSLRDKYTTRMYQPSGLIASIKEMKKGGTSIFCRGSTTREECFMCLGVLEFPHQVLNRGNQAPKFGGFSIDSEVKSDGKIQIIEGQSFEEDNLVITSDEAYEAIVRYARQTRTIDECRDGLAVAAVLYMSEGIKSFSLPTCQGHMDIYVPAYQVDSSEHKVVPPNVVSSYLLAGAMTVARQALAMTCDLHAYFRFNSNRETFQFETLSSNTAYIYEWYAREHFGPAFGIMTLIDPLRLFQRYKKDPLNIRYMDCAWSRIGLGRSLPYSYDYYMRNGFWFTRERAYMLSAETLNMVVATYMVLGLFEDRTQDPLKPADMTDDDKWALHRLRRMECGLVEGRVCIQFAEPVVDMPHCEEEVDVNSWAKQELPPEFIRSPPLTIIDGNRERRRETFLNFMQPSVTPAKD